MLHEAKEQFQEAQALADLTNHAGWHTLKRLLNALADQASDRAVANKSSDPMVALIFLKDMQVTSTYRDLVLGLVADAKQYVKNESRGLKESQLLTLLREGVVDESILMEEPNDA